MDKNILITPHGHSVLTAKRKELVRTSTKKNADGNIVAAANHDLLEINEVLDNAVITNFDENTPVSVIIGCNVMLENLKNGDKREYTIMTRSTSNPLKGVLSNESPIAQKMMGFKLGNTFKFKDISGVEDSYKIASIE
jgi:transcription elongation GreA/GreB family factor